MQSIDDIGILAWGTRLKRLYDNTMPQGKEIYQSQGLDFDPKWFSIVYALVENGEQSVTDLSNILGLAHPTIIQTLKELEKNGWVQSRKSETDGRMRLLSLSDSAKNKLPQLQKIWSQIRQATEEANQEGQSNFWQGFLDFEAAIEKRTFYDRVLEVIERQKRRDMSKRPPSHPGQWFDRKFDFSNLSTTPEGLLERLRSTPIRLQALVDSLSPTQLKTKLSDKWTIQENIGHMNDLEPLWHARILDISAGAEIMTEADLENTKTHQANHDELPLEKLLAEFRANRLKMVQLCEVNYDLLTSASSKHPRLLTPMRIIDLMYFVAEHDDHHIATIRHMAWEL